jgi:hypothetical protein
MMLQQVDVYYEGWGERWLWGTLLSGCYSPLFRS